MFIFIKTPYSDMVQIRFGCVAEHGVSSSSVISSCPRSADLSSYGSRVNASALTVFCLCARSCLKAIKTSAIKFFLI